MECLETTPRSVVLQYKTLQEASPRNQESRPYVFRNFKPRKVKDEHCNCTRQTPHIYVRCIRGSRIPPIWAKNEPSSPVGRWSRSPPVLLRTIKRTTNISQNGTKGFTQQIAKRTPWDKIYLWKSSSKIKLKLYVRPILVFQPIRTARIQQRQLWSTSSTVQYRRTLH